ncbi:hypothetical protein ABPG75_001742 [Micractinium tetrahymenae]
MARFRLPAAAPAWPKLALFLALATLALGSLLYLCNMTWRPRYYLEDWLLEQWCTPAAPGQADPELEEALAGCTAGAPFTSVPIGSTDNGVNQYWNNSILFDMENFQYNDTFARLALGGSAPPKQFTFIYFVGYGCIPPDHVAKQLRQMNETGDAVVLNLGPHCLSRISFAEWRRNMDELAPMLGAMRSKVVWRTSFPMREDAWRTGLPDTSTFSSHLFFPTEARRQLFDSYAEYAMRKAGVPVWDITAYGMGGLYRLRDMQHFDGQSTRTLNLDMALNIFC